MPVKFELSEKNLFPIQSLEVSEHPISPTRSITSTSSPGKSKRSIRRTVQEIVESENEDFLQSPRLSGYFFMFTSYMILLISSMKAQNSKEIANPELPVNEWKQKASLYGSVFFITASILIVAGHFDRFLMPSVWKCILKRGSIVECVILSMFMTFALFLVYAGTSSTGLGGFAGLNSNIYFSSWIGFSACIYTFDLWLKDTQQPSIAEWLKIFSSKTNFNWLFTLLFAILALVSQIDVFYVGKMLSNQTSILMMSASAATVILCLFALIMNRYFHTLKWHAFEGVISLGLAGFWSWTVFTFVGTQGLINSPSNVYIAPWGLFYFSISTFTMWLKENMPDSLK